MRAVARSRGGFRPLAVALGLLLIAPSATRAGEPVDKVDRTSARAQARFAAGTVLYQAGDYRGAIVEFEAGWELAPRPAFLVNIGQAWRKLGDKAAALAAFRRYLAEAGPKDPERPAVQQLVDEMERERRAAEPPPAPPKKGRLAEGIRRWWWTIPAGSAVVAGAAVGVWLAATWPPCDHGSAGCIDLRR